jgi:hypothetical protein
MSLGAGPALALALLAAAPAQGAERVEAERMQIAPRAGHSIRDATASNGRALVLSGRGQARARVELGAASRLTVVARARRCAGAPRLVVRIDGARVLSHRVRGNRWAPRRPRPGVQAGSHAVSLRLANPHRSRRCRRAVVVDSLRLRPGTGAKAPAPAPRPGPAPAAPGRWVPGPRTTWQWQLTTPVDLSVDAQLFDIDLFNNPASVVASLHQRGSRAVCYFSAGSTEPGRPDTGDFPAAVVGNELQGWPGEHWLDVRRLDVIGPIMERRLDLCKQKGFDGVEPDNVDAYANSSGFPLTADDQLRYSRFLAAAAHARGLSIGLKNDLEQVAALEPDFDWALNEQCFEYGECGMLQPFVRAGKAVFVAEYALDNSAFCPPAAAAGLMAMRKTMNLDAWRQPCW